MCSATRDESFERGKPTISIDNFLRDYEKMVRWNARNIPVPSGAGRDDLYQDGLIMLWRLYETNTIDWNRHPGEIRKFIKIRVKGEMLNKAKKAWSHRRREPEPEIDGPGGEEVAEDITYILPHGEIAEMKAKTDFEGESSAIKEALCEYYTTFDDEARFIFSSYHLDGRTQEEIGRLLGVSHTEVGRRLKATRERLMECLRERAGYGQS